MRVPGLLRFVGFTDIPAPISSTEIESIQRALANQVTCSPCDILKTGQRVRICSGSLAGVEGILVGRDGQKRLVVSIELINRAMEVAIEGYDVEPA